MNSYCKCRNLARQTRWYEEKSTVGSNLPKWIKNVVFSLLRIGLFKIKTSEIIGILNWKIRCACLPQVRKKSSYSFAYEKCFDCYIIRTP